MAASLLLLIANAHGQELRKTHAHSFSGSLSGSHVSNEVMTSAQVWRSKLVSAGVLIDSGPVRIGLPLLSLGPAGPRLMLMSLPKAGEGGGAHRFMFVLSKQID